MNEEIKEKIMGALESFFEAGIWFSSAMIGALISIYVLYPDKKLFNWIMGIGSFIAIAVGLKIGWIDGYYRGLQNKKYNEIINNQKLILERLENKKEINKDGDLVLRK